MQRQALALVRVRGVRRDPEADRLSLLGPPCRQPALEGDLLADPPLDGGLAVLASGGDGMVVALHAHQPDLDAPADVLPVVDRQHGLYLLPAPHLERVGEDLEVADRLGTEASRERPHGDDEHDGEDAERGVDHGLGVGQRHDPQGNADEAGDEQDGHPAQHPARRPARPRLTTGLGARLDALWKMVGDRGPQCARRPNLSRIRL
jgi:hypothetical protein